MLCAHAEKLIPLYAGNDLPARQADALRLHLESCANCRLLAAEFEESRHWLRGFGEQQFDEAALDGMRDSVLRDIGRIENRPRRYQWLIPCWNLQYMAAMSMLLLIALVAVYVYRGGRLRPDPDKKYVVITIPSRDQHNEGIKVNPSPVPAQRSAPKRARRIIETPIVMPDHAPDREIARISFSSSPINIDPASFNREMTRIEFQTADPNIRIIWLTPKDSNSSSTKPAINTR